MRTRCAITASLRGIPLVALLLCVPSFSQQQYQQWVARYDGPAGGQDYASGIAVDFGGNAYVTGWSMGTTTGYDYCTIKYGPDGTALWKARYNGPGNGDDMPVAIALDGEGGVIVFGQSTGRTTGYDYSVAKYDTDGNELWVRRYDAGLGVPETAVAMAVGRDLSIYVTGNSTGATTGQDFVTVKYDRDGNLQWAQRFTGPANGNDYPFGIAVDLAGNAFVTGWVTMANGYDYCTVKYDSAGNQRWARTYDGPTGGDDGAWAVATDLSGNVYVTGWSQGMGSGHDFCTIKYDTNGAVQWVQRHDGGAMGEDQARAIAVDAYGNVYVTGFAARTDGTSDCHTLKYDTYGTLLWVRRYDGPAHGNDMGYAITVDSHGNVYVAGPTHVVATSWDYFTIVWDANGNQLLAQTYDGPGASGDVAVGVAADGNGDVWTTGYSAGANGLDFGTVKYSWSTLSGKVALDSYKGGAGIAGVLEYRSPGTVTPVATAAIVLDAAGNYTDPLAPVGTFDVACRFPNWLRQVRQGVVIGQSGATASFSLTNGDANADNQVNLLDLSIVLTYFGRQGTPPIPGDLNWDGTVNLVDLSIVLTNFGKQGAT